MEIKEILFVYVWGILLTFSLITVIVMAVETAFG
jgi:hypothetical protein